jgi:hypothetical protein
MHQLIRARDLSPTLALYIVAASSAWGGSR